MKRSAIAVALLVSAVGCNNPSQEMNVLGIPAPDDKCKVPNPVTEFLFGSLQLDVGFNLGLSVPVQLQNNLSERANIPVGKGTAVGVLSIVNTITPTRFVSQWECDTNNSSNYVVGGFYLPRFSVSVPYCLSRQSDLKESEGFDIIAASGPAIPPAGQAAVGVDIVPTTLGRDIEEMLRLAVLADKCSRALSQMASTQPCTDLEKFFKPLSLTVMDGKGGPSADVQKFAPFALFDGDYMSQTMPPIDPSYVNAEFTPSYSMRLTGVFEGFTGYGQDVQSNEFAFSLDLCKNCGPPNLNGRDPIYVTRTYTGSVLTKQEVHAPMSCFLH